MEKLWEEMAMYILEAYYLDNENRNSGCIVTDNLEGNHSGYIQHCLIKHYITLYGNDYCKNLFKLDLNEQEKIKRKKYIHDEVQNLLQKIISGIIKLLSVREYYQAELSRASCLYKSESLKKLKDNNWIIRTIMEMCVEQNIVTTRKVVNKTGKVIKRYYKIKEYEKIQYTEKNRK